ncbi:unnamed protein product [Effrenium voratum]|uniref:Tyrosine specific protein phosphatases domain-containing protein n=1 Tax=Effrenium voratum TaxID=2562239 RepID=A0AA36MRC5_9DINO|nr:unnamed protein product [Effrenium voratum]
MPLLSLMGSKPKSKCGLILPGMVKPSCGDTPPSDDEAEPQSQVSTSITSASHHSLASLESSCHGMANLGQGVWWVGCSDNQEVPGPAGITPEMLPSALESNAQDVMESLQQCALTGDGESRNGSLRAFYPEEMECLGRLKWDGDGHYVLAPFPGDHPPTLGQVMSFLKMVDAAVSKSKMVVLVTTQRRRAVTAALAGALLVLARGFSPEEAWQHIHPVYGLPKEDPKVAWDRFPPPFSHSGETGPSSLTVFDCLRGLAVAREKNWLEDYRLFDVAAWKMMREKFDASWLIPGEILAMANPWGTSQNPRFPGLLNRGPAESMPSSQSSPDLMGSISQTSSFQSSSHLDAWPEDTCEAGQATADLETILLSQGGDLGTDEEVCNSVNAAVAAENAGSWKLPFSRSEEFSRLEADTFVSLLLRNSIQEVARLNYDAECPEQRGYEKAFAANGIKIKKVPFQDGNIPNKAVVKEFLKSCQVAVKRKRTIALHCQGGMGRTGVMAGAHAAAHHQVDGKAFHGWTRICRPGTVQTVVQEEFLREMEPEPITKSSSLRSIMDSCRLRFISV